MYQRSVHIAWLSMIVILPSFFLDFVSPCYSGELKPNVILMMADDMGMGDTSAYQDYTGNPDHAQIHTPNMSRLARMGVRFTDAHTPASRCTLTRYALMTGRYSWRNRLKHWVLFGSQGDPMIESDRPTLGTLFQSHGYRTGLVGKWHIGLRYRQSDGRPASGWIDADLQQPMYDTPLDHGFDYCRFTSRSHGTSGPARGGKKKANDASQSIGPGHLHGRTVIGATDDGKRIVDQGDSAYVLEKLGSRHLANAKHFLSSHLAENQGVPFFLYYACNSNHGPHTPEREIDGISVAGAARSVAGKALGTRADYVYENDVVLGSLLNLLHSQDDPRNPGKKLIENTIVIFTSDNGAEIAAKSATGPFRSNKGSVYEGGHRVPFLVSWPRGNVGDGSAETPGASNSTLLGLQDMFATFGQILDSTPVDFAAGEKGGEDSVSVLDAWRGATIGQRQMFFNDHKEAPDHAVLAFRSDDPFIQGTVVSGAWKLFLDENLLREGKAFPVELYNLSTDPRETRNLLEQRDLQPLINELLRRAVEHRCVAGHQLVGKCKTGRLRLSWAENARSSSSDSGSANEVIEQDLQNAINGANDASCKSTISARGFSGLEFTIRAELANGKPASGFDLNARGLGVTNGAVKQVDSGEKLTLSFNRDVLVESAVVVAGFGKCGGSYQKGTQSPMAIYCVDDDIDENDQSGILSDIGYLRAGEKLVLDSSPHLGVEQPGRWRLDSINIRLVKSIQQ